MRWLSVFLAAVCAATMVTGALAAGVHMTTPAVQPAAKPFKLGQLQLATLRDGKIVLPNDNSVFGVGLEPAAVAKVLAAAGAPTGHITLGLNSLLVRGNGRVTLIDTGLGPAYHSALMASLKLAGVAPDAVTDILITHSHPDHTGGLLDAKGRLAFPRARIRMSRKTWAALKKRLPTSAVATLALNVAPFAPGGEVVPGIRSLALPGHAPGNVGYVIQSGQKKLLDVSDVVHSSIVSLARPSWRDGFDSEPQIAIKTREALLARLARENIAVFAPHFPYPAVGHITTAGDRGYRWEPGLP